MTHQIHFHFRVVSAMLFSFIIFAPVFFVSAQSDGTASRPDASVPSADGTGSVPPSTETAAPLEVPPRTVPETSTSPGEDIVAPVSAGTATPSPRPAIVPSVPVQVSPSTPDDEQGQTFGALEGLSLPTDAEKPPSFPYTFVALGLAILLAPYGLYRLLSKNDSVKMKEEGGRCDDIKKLLERKKSTLEIVTGTLSLQQALVERLTKKIDEKKEEIQDDIKYEVIDRVAGEETGKVVRRTEEVKETYDELVEKLETAKRAIEYFMNRQKRLGEDVGKIESAYQTCMVGSSVFEGVSHLGRGLEIFEASLSQKLYRYTSQKKDILSPDVLSAEHKAEATVGKWLVRPELPPGEHRFFLTEKGKEEYEKTLESVHKKYFADIVCEETKQSEIDGIAYEDEWQIIAENRKS